MTSDDIASLNKRFEHASPQDLLAHFVKEMGKDLVLASSLGVEDQVLTHMLVTLNPKPRIFVLDTGRLHDETYETMAITAATYGFQYELYFPKTEAVESMVREKGVNLFYESIENRKTCCHVRKVEPLQRALSHAKGWITGLRRAQSVTRADIQPIEWDDTHSILKLNPLASWSEEDVWAYIKQHDIPINRLHKQGFPSIGCAPCTRAVKPGDDPRSGRWWWENPDSRECGLHVKN
jgi:phosphoadenosine phosphosulfate reductase